MGAYNAILDTLVTEAPKIRRNPAESGGIRRIVDHTYYVLRPCAPHFALGVASRGLRRTNAVQDGPPRSAAVPLERIPSNIAQVTRPPSSQAASPDSVFGQALLAAGAVDGPGRRRA